MALAFFVQNITVPSGTGRRTIDSHVNFSRTVNQAAVALNGFKLDYDNDDHHINVVEVDTDFESISGNTVFFRVECQYADKNFDDDYAGTVSVLVIADLA